MTTHPPLWRAFYARIAERGMVTRDVLDAVHGNHNATNRARLSNWLLGVRPWPERWRRAYEAALGLAGGFLDGGHTLRLRIRVPRSRRDGSEGCRVRGHLSRTPGERT